MKQENKLKTISTWQIFVGMAHVRHKKKETGKKKKSARLHTCTRVAFSSDNKKEIQLLLDYLLFPSIQFYLQGIFHAHQNDYTSFDRRDVLTANTALHRMNIISPDTLMFVIF